MTASDTPNRARSGLVFLLMVMGTVLGLTGVDLVLPAIPDLPLTLSGSAAMAQGVLAAYVAGSGAGLLIFGALAAPMGRRRLMLLALLLFAAASYAGTLMTDLLSLTAMRFVQGMAGAAPAVFAPAIIRQVFDEKTAIRAFGLLGSIESLVPALAPVAGVWLLTMGDWRLSFTVTAVGALVLAWALVLNWKSVPQSRPVDMSSGSSYLNLIMKPQFLRYAMGHAATLGGLLIWVFAAPKLFVGVLGGDISNFITMQVGGISLFIFFSNVSNRIVAKLGAEQTMWLGSFCATFGAAMIVVEALSQAPDWRWIAASFLFVNTGLGIRGPVGFVFAMKAADGDDDRGASLTVLAFMSVAAGGSALVAPFIETSLLVPALAAFSAHLVGLLLMFFIKPLVTTMD